jgi:hypothetical protein
MDVLLVLAVVAVAVLVIIGPLRANGEAGQDVRSSAERAELEATKEAKFREIRDAELDYRTGKIARDDWRSLDSALRAEAIELLRRLDELDGRRGGDDEEPQGSREAGDSDATKG